MLTLGFTCASGMSAKLWGGHLDLSGLAPGQEGGVLREKNQNTRVTFNSTPVFGAVPHRVMSAHAPAPRGRSTRREVRCYDIIK